VQLEVDEENVSPGGLFPGITGMVSRIDVIFVDTTRGHRCVMRAAYSSV